MRGQAKLQADGTRRRPCSQVFLAGLVAILLSCAGPDDQRDAEATRARGILDAMKSTRGTAEAGEAPAAVATESDDPSQLLESMLADRREASEPGGVGARSAEPSRGEDPRRLLEDTRASRLETEEATGDVPAILEDLTPDETPSTVSAAGGDPTDLDAALSELAQAVQGEPASPAAAPDVEPAVAPAVSAPPSPPVSAPTEVASAETPAAPVLRSGGAPAQEAPQEESRPRPEGKVQFFSFYHKTTYDFIRFLKDDFKPIYDKGHVAEVQGKPRSAMFFGDDATLELLQNLASAYDDIGLKLEQVPIRPRYIDVRTLMEALHLASVANVWQRVNENVTTQMIEGNKWKAIGSLQRNVYTQGGIASGQEAPVPISPRVPYVFEMPTSTPLQIPPQPISKGSPNQMTIPFDQTSSTEARGAMVAVGTAEDVARIQAFVDTVDRPARRIMIEVQLIELDANSLSDLGIDSIQFGQRHSIGTFTSPLPGEPIIQPGLPDEFRRDGVQVPDVVQEGIGFIFDDTTEDISGRFLATVHALVRQGDAKVKARPKILTLDDRVSLIHIGDQVPTFESTRVDRDVTGGNFVEQINTVTTQYVGFTLNIRPRVTGEKDDEVSMLIEVVANQLRDRQRVFEEDLLGIPVISTRKYLGETRVRNHRPIILGGLISEEEAESTAKVPFLGDIPILGRLFSRVTKSARRKEAILVMTPHILSDRGVDPVATPKESIHFDTFDSVLFNDRYILKGRDVWGIDPITRQPATLEGEVFTEDEVIDLTLLNIVKTRELVSKLGIFSEYLPDEAASLGWLQRRYPERSVYYWDEDEKEVYYKAAAIVIENIKTLNPDLDYEELVLPRREIVLPTTPYRMSLTFDRYKTLVAKGGPVLRDTGTILSHRTVSLLRDVSQKRSMRQFAEYARRMRIKAEDHKELRSELERLYTLTYPESNAAATDDYVELLELLAESRIGFIAMATYFQENLDGRYRTRGAPNVGTFEHDLEDFLDSTITISQRAKRLKELDEKWSMISGDDADGADDAPEN